jgi:molybdate transport system substrate-binding protein
MSLRLSQSSTTRRPLLVGAFLVLVGCSKRGGGPEPLRVAAASDLALAFKDVGAAFEKESGKRVDLVFGSTGLLAKQIADGAPYDVFAAANVSFVDDVVRSGACLGETKAMYARGRIALWSKEPATLPKDLGALSDPKFKKVAIANPEHAPYGRAAREAMTKVGVWESVQPRAVYGENVQQALTFASSGNAEVAVVALSLAISTPGHYAIIDSSLHAPLDQALVVCKGGSKGARTADARAFADFVGSPAGRTIMRRYGFLLPGDAPPQP